MTQITWTPEGRRLVDGVPDDFRAIRYLLSFESRNAVTLECVNYDTFDAWVIRDGIGQCLPRDGEWQFEPAPSARVAAFIARTRYKSVDEALDRWRARQRGDAWSGQ